MYTYLLRFTGQLAFIKFKLHSSSQQLFWSNTFLLCLATACLTVSGTDNNIHKYIKTITVCIIKILFLRLVSVVTFLLTSWTPLYFHLYTDNFYSSSEQFTTIFLFIIPWVYTAADDGSGLWCIKSYIVCP